MAKKIQKIVSVKFEFTGIDSCGPYASGESDLTAEVNSKYGEIESLDDALKRMLNKISEWDEDPEVVEIYGIEITYKDGSIKEYSAGVKKDQKELQRLTDLAKDWQ